MSYIIAKTFTFDASHQLAGMPEGHKCGRLHGHTYTVEVILQSDVLDQYGFVRDYGDLSQIKRWIDLSLDHRNLGVEETIDAPRVLDFQPTAERIAAYIYERWTHDYPELVAVRVSETPTTSAEYRP